jgi:hypothetical protein
MQIERFERFFPGYHAGSAEHVLHGHAKDTVSNEKCKMQNAKFKLQNAVTLNFLLCPLHFALCIATFLPSSP